MEERNTHFRTAFLLPKNNFLVGMGSVLNIRGSYFKYSTSKSAQAADKKAIASDWGIVGQDIKSAARKLHSEK
jgi:hypothetical protein